MKEMTSEEIDRALKLVDRWQPPYGPMHDVDPQTEMEAEVARLGQGAGRTLARLLAERSSSQFRAIDSLLIFCGEYFDAYPEEMTEALFGELGAKDPALIVSLLGAARTSGASQKLIDGLALDFENHLLVNTLIETLREQGDPVARKFLQEMPRERLTPELRSKLERELEWLAKHPEHGMK